MNWLRNLFTENLGLKLLSLTLAVALWSALGGDARTEIFVSVPVEFRNVPSGVRFTAEPSQVQLRIRGPRRVVRATAHSDFSAWVDFSERTEGTERTEKTETGERVVPLRPEDVEAPASLEVVEVIPDRVQLTVETVPEE